MKTLDGKTAVVTGASRGIGLEICNALAEAGADIVGFDVLEEELQKAMEAVASDYEVKTLALVADVAQLDAITGAIQQAAKEMGSIDILVNNAGITRDGLILRMTEEDWDRVLEINLKGAFNCIKAASRIMMKQRSGRIVNIASVVGAMGNAGQANYAASKAGLMGLTKAAAREFAARNVTVNAVAPGYIKTAMTEKLPEDAREQLQSQIPLRRLGEPADVARAVRFLCSPDSDYITGHVLHVNGGMVMQ